MAQPGTLTETEQKALREQAIMDVATTTATTMEMVIAGHDITTWVAEQTAHWTGEHGRQAVLIIGMLASGTELDPGDVVLMAKTLLDS